MNRAGLHNSARAPILRRRWPAFSSSSSSPDRSRPARAPAPSIRRGRFRCREAAGSTAIPAPVDPSAPPVAANPPAAPPVVPPPSARSIESRHARPRQRGWLCAFRHRALAARRAVPERRRRSIRLRLQRLRSLRLRAARRRDAATGPRSVPRRQERRSRSAGARRPGVLQYGRAGRLARRHRDRRRSVHPRAERARRGPRRESQRSSTWASRFIGAKRVS